MPYRGSGMEIEVVVRAQRGDQGAYAQIAEEIGDHFLAVARRILRDLDLAEDATQQALIAVWQNIPQLRDPARFEAWSYRLLVRACYAEGRRQRRWAPNLRLLPSDEPVDDDLSSVVDRDQLERGFRSLSMDHRTVVVLYHYLDLPLERIAEICGIPTGTAHSRLHHAMRALRAALDADLRQTAREAS
jgi:RNA polymerase sigma factor (sigma-70 family)